MMKHPKPLSRLDGKVAVVTGASDGIGVETARYLADLGATLVLPVRNMEKAAAVRDDLARTTGSDRIELMPMDLASLASVRAFAWPDPRVSTLFELVHAAHARGDVPLEAARDLVVRTRLLQQALRQGHARHATASVSPLSVVDMEFLLWQCLGQPMRQHWVHGGKVLEYDLRTGVGAAQQRAHALLDRPDGLGVEVAGGEVPAEEGAAQEGLGGGVGEGRGEGAVDLGLGLRERAP